MMENFQASNCQGEEKLDRKKKKKVEATFSAGVNQGNGSSGRYAALFPEIFKLYQLEQLVLSVHLATLSS